jgi:hypothetical protein
MTLFTRTSSVCPSLSYPRELGALLGQVAAEAMIDRSTEAGEITEPWEIERLIAQLADAVRARHYG